MMKRAYECKTQIMELTKEDKRQLKDIIRRGIQHRCERCEE